MKKIISIVGARPQFIKLSALSNKLKARFNEVIVHTGQHYDNNMSDVFFKQLGISFPKYDLSIGSGLHGFQTAQMMIKIEEIIIKERPDLAIIFGDTNSTLAGVLITSKLGVPTVHVEAGLRSFNKKMPEELNRLVADQLSDYLFAPNSLAMNNLEKEGMFKKAVLTGDIMVDSVMQNVESALKNSSIKEELGIKEKDYYLLTLHRPYNVDDPINVEKIFHELSKLSLKVVFPMHPRTKKIISDEGISIPNNFVIINPVGYIDFLNLQSGSFKIITDSGGIQKEAYILKVPCITLRSETEWMGTVEAGWNLLVDTSKQLEFSSLIENFSPVNNQNDLFGTNVSERMVDLISGYLR